MSWVVSQTSIRPQEPAVWLSLSTRSVRHVTYLALMAVAIVAGTVLPYLASRDRRLLKPATEKNVVDEDEDEDEEDGELERIRDMVKQWKAEAARNGRPMKLPTSTCRCYQSTHCSAIHVAQYLDRRTAALRCSYGFNLFHYQSLAGELRRRTLPDHRPQLQSLSSGYAGPSLAGRKFRHA